MPISRRILFFLLVVSSLLAACTGATSAPTPTGTANDLIDTTAELADALRERGFTVEPAGSEEAFLLPQAAQLLDVNGQRVNVWEYANLDGADGARLSLQGPNSPLAAVDFIAAPRFYQSGRMIVLFVDIDPEVTKALTDILGEPFL